MLCCALGTQPLGVHPSGQGTIIQATAPTPIKNTTPKILQAIGAPKLSINIWAIGDIMKGPQAAPAWTKPEIEPLLSGNHFNAVGKHAG